MAGAVIPETLRPTSEAPAISGSAGNLGSSGAVRLAGADSGGAPLGLVAQAIVPAAAETFECSAAAEQQEGGGKAPPAGAADGAATLAMENISGRNLADHARARLAAIADSSDEVVIGLERITF